MLGGETFDRSIVRQHCAALPHNILSIFPPISSRQRKIIKHFRMFAAMLLKKRRSSLSASSTASIFATKTKYARLMRTGRKIYIRSILTRNTDDDLIKDRNR